MKIGLDEQRQSCLVNIGIQIGVSHANNVSIP